MQKAVFAFLVLYRLNEKKYLSSIHGSHAINENKNPHVITCMILTLFPYGIGALEMQHYIVKIFPDSHVQYLPNLTPKIP
jgi:hypothetical protein